MKWNPNSIWKQILIAALLVYGFYSMIISSQSYTWILNLAQNNLEYIAKNPDLTTDQKQQIKLGAKANLMQFFKHNTPENAIILMPRKEHIRQAKEINNKGSASLTNASYAAYFVYPRKLVYPEQIAKKPRLKDSLTHVAVINYQGYENLPYRVGKKSKYSILPIEFPTQ